jgi:CheY-like chemotaxis protein
MNALQSTPISFLDDEPRQLSDAKSLFGKYGCSIHASSSIDELCESVMNGAVEIFICDLHLDRIKGNTKQGYEILTSIRKGNKSVFLALYTAFIRDLTPASRQILEQNEIKIYDKADQMGFILNLNRDYEAFRKKKSITTTVPPINSLITISNEIGLDIITRIIDDLKGVSNQDMIIPVDGVEEDVSVKQMIKEVKNETETGRKYAWAWYKTILMMFDIKNQNKLP